MAFEVGDYMVKAKKTLLTSGIIDLIFTVVYGILGIVTIVIGLAMMGNTEESYGVSAFFGVLFVAIAICSFFALALSIVSTILGLKCATKKQIEYNTSKVPVIIASAFNFVESAVFLISAVVFIAKETDEIHSFCNSVRDCAYTSDLRRTENKITLGSKSRAAGADDGFCNRFLLIENAQLSSVFIFADFSKRYVYSLRIKGIKKRARLHSFFLCFFKIDLPFDYQRLSFLTIAQPLLALATAAIPFFAPVMSAYPSLVVAIRLPLVANKRRRYSPFLS